MRVLFFSVLLTVASITGCAGTHDLLHEVEEPQEEVASPETREEAEKLVDERIELYILRDVYGPTPWGSKADSEPEDD